MFHKNSTCTRTIILAMLFLTVSSIPVLRNSRDIKCVTEMISQSKLPEDIPRRNSVGNGVVRQTKELPARGLFNLDDRVIAILSKLANLRYLSLAGDQYERRSIPIPQKTEPVSVEKVQNFSPLTLRPEKDNVRGTEVLERTVSVRTPEKLEFKPRKFHCHPIEDIYIPAVDRMVPAYICKLGLRQFILSSERFLQDHKYHLNVTIDETTFHHLGISDDIRTGNSIANVIPVTLTQRQGEEFYGVKGT